MQKTATRFNLSSQTVHLAMLYFDQTIADKSLYWQINAVTCFALACKFQDRDDKIPRISEILTQFGVSQSVHPDDIHAREPVIMKLLDWDLNKVTTVSFL